MPFLIDPITAKLLTATGVVSILAGLYFLMRPGTQAAKIELLGLKFESSSAGILVFLVGVGMLAHPVFTDPEPPAATGGAVTLPLDQTVIAPGAPSAHAGVAIPLEARRAIFLDGAEQEPNDSIPQANVIPLGASVTGKVDQGESDFFTVLMPEAFDGVIALNVTGDVSMRVFDDLGATLSNSMTTYKKDAVHQSYSIQIYPSYDRKATYLLTVAARAAP